MIAVPAVGLGVVFMPCSITLDSDNLLKRQYPSPGGAYMIASEPTDSVGLAEVTFDGVVAGSEIRVFLPDMTEVAGVETCAANQVLSWPVYASALLNAVRILILNEQYRLKEIAFTAQPGAQTLPIQMEPDKWFRNP